MPRRQEPLPDAELQVLKALWETSAATARELAASIYGGADATTIGTVQKLLQRLEKKGCVRRDRREFVHRFSAKVSRDEVAGWHLNAAVCKFADGSLAPFLTYLIQGQRLSEAEKAEIRRLLDE